MVNFRCLTERVNEIQALQVLLQSKDNEILKLKRDLAELQLDL